MKSKNEAKKRSKLKKSEKSSSSKSLPSKRISTATATAIVLCAFLATQLTGNTGALLSDRIQELIATIFPPQFKILPFDDISNGHFPSGCRWRDAYNATKPIFWDIRHYEYWDDSTNTWSNNQPAACRLDFERPSSAYRWKNESRSGFECTKEYCIAHNVWYNQGRFYYLTDDEDGISVVSITRSMKLSPIVVKNASLFPSQVDARVVKGNTLLIDFIFYTHPTAIGHWVEHTMPLISAFRELGSTFPSPPHRIVVLNLKRTHIMEWVRGVIAIALGLPRGDPLPPLYLQEEISSMWKQMDGLLEGVENSNWVCFEKILIVKDIYSGGIRVGKTTEDSRTYRERGWEMFGISPPLLAQDGGGPPRPPRQVTLLRKSTDRRILNEEELLRVLRQYGPVKAVQFDANTTMGEQIAILASTGLVVSVHTSALANAVFLPPGAAILELIHRNWAIEFLDQSFKVQSGGMGDIHHWAWRAWKKEHGQYINPRDNERFGGDEWANEKCNTDECVEAHTNIDVIVDLNFVEKLLKEKMPLVWAGVPPANTSLPWPKANGQYN